MLSRIDAQSLDHAESSADPTRSQNRERRANRGQIAIYQLDIPCVIFGRSIRVVP